jgi:hypothetical protein
MTDLPVVAHTNDGPDTAAHIAFDLTELRMLYGLVIGNKGPFLRAEANRAINSVEGKLHDAIVTVEEIAHATGGTP